MIVRTIPQTYRAWQRGSGPCPGWVYRCTEYRGSDLFHLRQSGDQLLNPGEYLVQDMDGITTFYTDEEFRAKFIIISPELA